jgi:hypothetical protein
MDNTSLLLWSMILGSIGLGYFIYGKKQKAIVPLVTGIGLFIIPYFISDIYILIISALLLMALPYFEEKQRHPLIKKLQT